jgi:hypothetical protein
MKTIPVLFVIALSVPVSLAQENHLEVVLSNNGSNTREVMEAQEPEESNQIIPFGQNVVVYESDVLKEITKDHPKKENCHCKNNQGIQPGYKPIVEWGFQIGVKDYGMNRLMLNIINGWQVSPHFSLGIGKGLRYFFDIEKFVVPVFADFRANFSDTNVSPYFSVGVGYSFDATFFAFENLDFFLNTSAGISLMVSDRTTMHIGLGYELQRLYFFDQRGFFDFVANSGAMSLSIGISF